MNLGQVLIGIIVGAILSMAGTFFTFQERISKMEVYIMHLEKQIDKLTDENKQLNIESERPVENKVKELKEQIDLLEKTNNQLKEELSLCIKPPPPPLASGRLEGTLADRRGKPISDISVSINNGPRTHTDMDGRFVLNNILPGDQLLVITAPSGVGQVTQNITIEKNRTTKTSIIYDAGISWLALLSITAPVDDGELIVNEDHDGEYRAMVHGRCDGMTQIFNPSLFDIWVLIRSEKDERLWVQHPPAIVDKSKNTWQGKVLFGDPKHPPQDGESWEIIAITAPSESDIDRILNTPKLSLLPPHISSNLVTAIIRTGRKMNNKKN